MDGKYSTWDMNRGISLQLQQTLNTLMETLIKPETLKRDLFFALILIVIKENDFVLKGNREINVVDCILSKKMDERTIYEVDVILNQFQDTPAKIIASPLSDMMLINTVIPKINKDTYALCLDVNEYVLFNSTDTVPTFDKLDLLFTIFKEKIIIPIMTSILNYHNKPSCSLHGLPDDVLYKILGKLPLKDVINVSKSCKRLNRLLEEERLWSLLCRNHFSIKTKNSRETWQNTYKNNYFIKQRNRFVIPSAVIREFEEISNWHNIDFPCAVII